MTFVCLEFVLCSKKVSCKIISRTSLLELYKWLPPGSSNVVQVAPLFLSVIRTHQFASGNIAFQRSLPFPGDAVVDVEVNWFSVDTVSSHKYMVTRLQS